MLVSLTRRDSLLHFVPQHSVHPIGQGRGEGVAELLAELLVELLLATLALRQHALQPAFCGATNSQGS